MTEKEKDLLVKDLCARLPHGVKVLMNDGAIEELLNVNVSTFICNGLRGLPQPYLFPLSSMTDEQVIELNSIGWYFDGYDISNSEAYYSEGADYVTQDVCYTLIDWLNKNHFDYRGLIDKGLAIDATGKNVY